MPVTTDTTYERRAEAVVVALEAYTESVADYRKAADRCRGEYGRIVYDLLLNESTERDATRKVFKQALADLQKPV